MKIQSLILFIILAFNCSAQVVQNTLDKTNMYADFDTLYKTISTVNPHDFVRKSVNQYAMLDSIKALRPSIERIKTKEEFYWLINKALTFCQDEHTSIVSKRFYNAIDSLDKIRLGITINDTSQVGFYSRLRRDRLKSIKLNLPLKYIDGAYRVLQSFSLNGKAIKQGSSLILYNQTSIADYLKQHLGDIEAMHWDFEKKCWYKDDFYQGNHIPLQQENTFTFSYQNRQTLISAGLTDTIQINVANKSLADNSDNTPFITFFPKEKLLYIRMPEMSNKDYYIKRLDSIRTQVDVKTISKVIWDIRGNAGGDDGVWINVLFRLLDKPIIRKLTLCFNEGNSYQYRFEEPNITTFKNNFVSDGYLQLPTVADTMDLFDDSWKLKCKIYVLQDEYCFSSAGSFISMCQFSDQLINVGNSTGWFAGFGRMPWVYMLPHSKIMYWIEPLLDFTNVKQPKDLFHNTLKLPVKRALTDYVEQYMNRGRLYSKEYLFNKDIVFLKVLHE